MKPVTKHFIKGTSFSPGYAIGFAVVWGIPSLRFSRKEIKKEDIHKELDRFQDAIEKTRCEIESMRNDFSSKIGKKQASIFDLQLLILEDPFLLEKMKRSLESDLLNAEFVFYEILRQYYCQFSFSENFYIRERWSDIEDVGRRVLKHLFGNDETKENSLPQNDPLLKRQIIIAKNLLVSDFAKMNTEKVVGLITCGGSQTSHVAILSRSLKIPAILSDDRSLSSIQNGDSLIIDAILGKICLNPHKVLLKDYEKKINNHMKKTYQLRTLKNLPAQTKDKKNIELFANIDRPEDLKSALDNGAQGIGLFRTEFLYMNREDLPNEEEQYNVYCSMLKKLEKLPLVVRTLDVGGDKFSSQLKIPNEQNPALGCRGIRYCLENVNLFKIQLKALFRASVHGFLKIMFPMISGREEFLLVYSIIEEVKKELTVEKKPFFPKVPVGVMIETPSSAITADLLTDLVDFFSIGTNDLAQYTLAIDRSHENAQSYSYRIHPSLLRLIQNILSIAKQTNTEVSLCGELSSDIIAIEVLLGLGLNSFSVSHTLLPDVKKVIRSISFKESQEFAKKLLTYRHAQDLENEAKIRFKKIKKL